MLIKFCSLGDLVLKLERLPMGGLLSKVASGFALAGDEAAWVRSSVLRFLRLGEKLGPARALPKVH